MHSLAEGRGSLCLWLALALTATLTCLNLYLDECLTLSWEEMQGSPCHFSEFFSCHSVWLQQCHTWCLVSDISSSQGCHYLGRAQWSNSRLWSLVNYPVSATVQKLLMIQVKQQGQLGKEQICLLRNWAITGWTVTLKGDWTDCSFFAVLMHQLLDSWIKVANILPHLSSLSPSLSHIHSIFLSFCVSVSYTQTHTHIQSFSHSCPSSEYFFENKSRYLESLFEN